MFDSYGCHIYNIHTYHTVSTRRYILMGCKIWPFFLMELLHSFIWIHMRVYVCLLNCLAVYLRLKRSFHRSAQMNFFSICFGFRCLFVCLLICLFVYIFMWRFIYIYIFRALQIVVNNRTCILIIQFCVLWGKRRW